MRTQLQVLQTFGLLFQTDPSTRAHRVMQKRLLPHQGVGGGGKQGAGLEKITLGDVLLSVNSIAGNLYACVYDDAEIGLLRVKTRQPCSLAQSLGTSCTGVT